jgi:DNA-binding NarL/FixJ family response regulator
MNKDRTKISIIIADDHKLFAEGLIAMLSINKGYNIIYVPNGKELIEKIDDVKPHLVLLDIKMPGMDGIEALTYIKRNQSFVKIIMLSTFSDVETINKCIYHGADAFLLKNVGIAELQQTIHEVMNNNRTIASMLPKDYAIDNKYAYFSQTYKLTKREWEIIQLIKSGKTNQQISDDLNLSIYTTETHRKNIMQKLKLKSPIALMRFIIDNDM